MGVKSLLAFGLLSNVGVVDYTPLYAYFDKAVNAADADSVYSDVARTTLATDGDYVGSLTEKIDGTNLSWTGAAERRSFFSTKFGSRYNLLRPVYKKPAGDIGHIFMPNMLDVSFQSSSFGAQASPNTNVFVIRNRVAVQDEGGIAFGLGIRDRSNDHLELSNSAASVELDAASGIPPVNEWSYLIAIDNGANSAIYLNNVLLGTVETLSAGSISQLVYGTNSHILEHDLAFAGAIWGAINETTRNEIAALIESLFPIGDAITAPHYENLEIAFDGTDTFTWSGDYAGTAAENVALRQVEWGTIRTIESPEGWTGLDGQAPVHRGETLVRAHHPRTFESVEGTGAVQLFVRVKCFDVNGNSWAGVAFRSEYKNDNVAGTVGTKRGTFTSASVEDSDKNRLRWNYTTFSSGSPSAPNAADFVVYKNGVSVSFTLNTSSFAEPNFVLFLDLEEDLTYEDEIIINYIPAVAPISDDNGEWPMMSTAWYNNSKFTNNIVGPQILAFNMYNSGPIPDAPWNTEFTDGSVGTVFTDVADQNGNGTDIDMAITSQFYTSANATPPTTIADGFEADCYRSGLTASENRDGIVTFSGFPASQQVTVQMAFWYAAADITASGDVIIGGETIAVGDHHADAVLIERTINCNGSGEFTIQLNNNSTGFDTLVCMVAVKITIPV